MVRIFTGTDQHGQDERVEMVWTCVVDGEHVRHVSLCHLVPNELRTSTGPRTGVGNPWFKQSEHYQHKTCF